MTRKARHLVRPLIAAALAATLAGGPARAASSPRLTGTWTVAVTLVDCSNGGALAPAFTSLLAFAGDGTEVEFTNNPALQLGQRSPGFGAWTAKGGGKYHLDAYALILFASTGSHPLPAGSQQIHQDITVSGDAFTSTAAIAFYDTSGTQVAAGCATSAASRLK